MVEIEKSFLEGPIAPVVIGWPYPRETVAHDSSSLAKALSYFRRNDTPGYSVVISAISKQVLVSLEYSSGILKQALWKGDGLLGFKVPSEISKALFPQVIIDTRDIHMRGYITIEKDNDIVSYESTLIQIVKDLALFKKRKKSLKFVVFDCNVFSDSESNLLEATDSLEDTFVVDISLCSSKHLSSILESIQDSAMLNDFYIDEYVIREINHTDMILPWAEGDPLVSLRIPAVVMYEYLRTCRGMKPL